MKHTADELDRLAADILALVPKLRAAAKALRKGAGAPVLAVTKAKKAVKTAKAKAVKAAPKKAARKTAKKKAPKKAVRKVARKSSARGR